MTMDPLRLHSDRSLIAPDAWIADTATLTAQVIVGNLASIWFGAVLRGDVEPITIGEASNVHAFELALSIMNRYQGEANGVDRMA